MGKAVKKIAKIAIPVAIGFALTGGNPIGALKGAFSNFGFAEAFQAGGLLTSVAGNIQSKKYQKQQTGFQREQVVEQNKAEVARNRYNNLQSKRSRLQSIRQGRIQQGQIEGQMGILGAGGTSSYTGSTGSIGTQTSANLGNINVAEDTGNQISGFNVAAANAGSQANTAASKSGMWSNASTLGGTLLSSGEEIGNIFKKLGG